MNTDQECQLLDCNFYRITQTQVKISIMGARHDRTKGTYTDLWPVDNCVSPVLDSSFWKLE